MNISILSGKGGTGKTTISTNLSVLLSETHENVQYLDFDVEEPNGFIFLKPAIESEKKCLNKFQKLIRICVTTAANAVIYVNSTPYL